MASAHPTDPRAPMTRWRRRTGLLALGVLAGTLVLPLPTAHAVSKATLWSYMSAAGNDYTAARDVWYTFPTADRVRWRSEYLDAAAMLTGARGRLNAADTQSEVDKVAPVVYRERSRARVFRVATSLAATSFSARRSAVSAGQAAFTAWYGGSITDSAYAERKADAAAVAALAAKDRRRAWIALGTVTTPTASEAKAKLPALTDGTRAYPPTGWIAVPGGCAVQTADSSWLGAATQPGRHLWADDATIADAVLRSVAGTAQERAADAYLKKVANSFKTRITSDLTAVASPLQQRSSRLGYAALMGDLTALSWIKQDLQDVLPPGPKTNNSLGDGVSLSALATDLDWIGWDESSDPQAARLREAMLVRWLGPVSCRFDDLEATVMDRDNISIIVDSGMLHGAYALAPSYPAIAAALVRAALLRLVPAAAVMTADGGSFEGPTYWNLQARYLGALYGTMDAVYGDNPPIALPSPSAAATYAWSSVANDGTPLPVGDSLVNPDGLRPGLLAWVAHRTTLPTAGALAREWLTTPGEGFQVLWWPTDGALATAQPSRVSSLFRRTGIASLQAGSTTAWLKGGTSKESHAHLDLGSVGFYKHGIQWAVDPGKDDYGLPQYSSSAATSKRWTYWKVSSKGHSTVQPAAGQPPLRSAPFSSFSPGSGSGWGGAGSATTNLLNAMPGASSATRTAGLSTSGVLTVADRVRSSVARSWTWKWITDAGIAISGSGSTRTVTLARDGRVVKIVLTGLPAGSSATVVTGPTSAKGPDGRQLRAVTLVLGKTTSLALNATVS